VVRKSMFFPYLFLIFFCLLSSTGVIFSTEKLQKVIPAKPVQIQLIHFTSPIIRMTIDEGQQLNMLVDTGAGHTYLSKKRFKKETFLLPRFCFENEICLSNFRVRTTDSAFTQAKEGYVNGILGMDVLRRFNITLDYKNNLLYLKDIQQKNKKQSSRVPIFFRKLRPHTELLIEGKIFRPVLLDTGASFTRMTLEMFDRLAQKPKPFFETLNYNFDNVEVVKYVAVTKICLHQICPEKVIVQVGKWPALGGSLFQRYLTTFRFEDRVVKFQKYFDTAHIKLNAIQRLGIQVNIFDASKIIYIQKGGPAWNAGIRENHTIRFVNGKSIAKMGYLGLYTLLQDYTICDFNFLMGPNQNSLQYKISDLDKCHR
jgi:hypothetical protein